MRRSRASSRSRPAPPRSTGSTARWIAACTRSSTARRATGTAGLDDLLRPSPGEQVFLVEDRFRDRAHQERVLQDVDADPEIDALFDELKTLIDLRRVVRAEWSLTPLP